MTALPRNAKVDAQKKFWRRQLLASKSNHRLPFPPPRMPPTAPFLSLTWPEIARRSTTLCRTCEFHFASHGVPCLSHTRPDERAARARRIGQGTGRIVVSRVATDETKNACSMLYGAICRAAQALGYREAWTYTLPEEPGVSLRASGFEDMGLTDGGEHDRKKRPRKPAKRSDPKRRWRRVLKQ